MPPRGCDRASECAAPAALDRGDLVDAGPRRLCCDTGWATVGRALPATASASVLHNEQPQPQVGPSQRRTHFDCLFLTVGSAVSLVLYVSRLGFSGSSTWGSDASRRWSPR